MSLYTSIKPLFLLTCLTLPVAKSYSQDSSIKGRLVDGHTNKSVIAAQVELYKDTMLIASTLTDQSGTFAFHRIPAGQYILHILQLGSRPYKLTSLQLPIDSVLLINYPPPCNFDDRQPNSCVNNHTDNIVPIVYGLPSKKTLKEARAGKLHLGGCVISDCDPKFYCKTHKREL